MSIENINQTNIIQTKRVKSKYIKQIDIAADCK